MRNYGLLNRTNACAALLLSVGLSACSSDRRDVTNPNVLLILTDDQGWGDFGFNGNDDIQTPVLDSLSEQSAHFTNFYVSPLSATTRAGLLTGRDHLRTGSLFVTRAAENMDADEVTLAEVLHENGYTTGCFGKWHNGTHYPHDPNGQGFDNFVGFCAGHYTNYFDTELQFNQEMKPVKGYITDVLTDYGIKYIKTCSQNQREGKNEPFFCYMAYNAPHAPYQVGDVYYDKYKHLQKDSLDTTPAVYAMCECVDYNIGRLMHTLEEEGVLENTIVLFMTDNGPNQKRYNGNMSGKKGDILEGGIKVPCLMYWKDKFIATKISETVSYIDIMPTILDLCGVQRQEDQVARKFDGMSFKSLLFTKDTVKTQELKESLRNRFLYTHRSTSDAELYTHNGLIFNNRYKLLVFKDSRKLVDKINDPLEKQDLKDECQNVFKSMSDRYDKWFEEVKLEYDAHQSKSTSVGILDSPVILPAHEAYIHGGVRYFTNVHGWAGDWLTGILVGDTIGWHVNVRESGTYAIELQYALNNEITPLKLAIASSANKVKTPGINLPIFKSKRIVSPDRVKRVEAYEQTWNWINLGEIKLTSQSDFLMLQIESDVKQIDGLEIKGMSIQKITD